MLSSSYPVSAVLIAGTQAPLRLGKDYVISWTGGIASGHIRSVTQRLKSPFVPPVSESLLHPRELAYVEIEVLSSKLPTTLMHCMQQLAIVEPVTKETVGSGLLIPDAGSDDECKPIVPVAGQGLAVWLTGLSGAGKTTIARQVQDRLRRCCVVEMLDADIVRSYLCKDLGYSKEDRDENVRRLAFVANLLTQKRTIVLITAIAPYRATRDEARRTIGRFMEVYVNASVAICEQRDVKGLYKRARAGEIRSFTGIDDPYEAPLTPEVECRTDSESVEVSVSKVIAAIQQELSRTLGSVSDCK
jgi:adenylylsulfate kinase